MLTLFKAAIAKYLRWRFYHWDRQRLEQHQYKQLTKLLAHVQKHASYYSHIVIPQSLQDFSQFPSINKAAFMENFNGITTADIARDELIEFAIDRERQGSLDLYQGQYSIGLSSGTSGNKTVTVLSAREMELYGALLWARNGVPSSVKQFRILFALRVNNPSFMEIKSFGIAMIYVDYTHPLDDLIDLINNKKLNILAGPPSLLKMIAQHKAKIGHQIETLVSYAEVLSHESKHMLETSFQAPVVQIYQGAEGFIGTTCRDGALHLNEDLSFIELSDAGDPDDNVKRVIVTDLYRTTLPFIRYELNDILEIDPQPCTCGSCFSVIKKIHGRMDDIFYIKDKAGNPIALFPDYVRRSISQASEAVKEYQAIQNSDGSIEIRLVTEPQSVHVEIEQSIRDNLDYWCSRIGGDMGSLSFSYQAPELHPVSKKMIRVWRVHD